MIETAIRQLLLADQWVAEIIADRVWFQLRPQGMRQAGVVLTRTGGSDPGTLEDSAGYATGSIDIACLAPTYRAAKQLALQVSTLLDGYTGTVSDTVIDWLSVDDQSDIPIDTPDGGASPTTFGVTLQISYMRKT